MSKSKKSYITVPMLKKAEACSEGIAKFESVFGDKAEISMDNLLTASRCGVYVAFVENVPVVMNALEKGLFGRALKPGDQVRVVDKDAARLLMDVAPMFVEGMFKYCGRIVTITKRGGYIDIKQGKDRWSWSPLYFSELIKKA